MPDLPRRPRRLRASASLRALVREHRLDASDLILPLFVSEKATEPVAVSSMPGVSQLPLSHLLEAAAGAQEAGLQAVLLFGLPAAKDEEASGAWNDEGIVQRAVRELRRQLPDLVVMTDVCLCEYMSHGHCGVVESGSGLILNDPSLELLARTALSHARAGAQIVAPSDMMDGRVGVIRGALDDAGRTQTAIMSYAAKFASAFYGPFREAAESAPQFGDRRSYQMDAANAREALREVSLDVEEGADIVMVKPGLPYLDLVWRVKERFELPTAAYQVSGEYAMIKAAAARGWIDERAILLETMTAFRRAGADLILTYAAVEVARWLREGS